MFRQGKGARRYNEPITLTRSVATKDEYGHISVSEPVDMMTVYAEVKQLNETLTMRTFQRVDVVGLEIEFRNPNISFNGLRWRGYDVHFGQPKELGRGMVLQIQGYYQADDPIVQ